MNLGRKNFIPQHENGAMNNGEPPPMTPQRPVLLRPNVIPADLQANQMKMMNWQILNRPDLVPVNLMEMRINHHQELPPQRHNLPSPNLIPGGMQQMTQMEQINWQDGPRQILTQSDLIHSELQCRSMERINHLQGPLQRPNLPGPNLIQGEMKGNWIEGTNWQELPAQISTQPHVTQAAMQWNQMERVNHHQESPQRPFLPAQNLTPAGMQGKQIERLYQEEPQRLPTSKMQSEMEWKTIMDNCAKILKPGARVSEMSANVNSIGPTDGVMAFQNTVSLKPQFFHTSEGPTNNHWNNTPVRSINLNQNIDSYAENIRQPTTLAEVLWRRNTPQTPCHRNAAPDTPARFTDKPVTCNSYSQFEGSYYNDCHPASTNAASDCSRQYQPHGPTNWSICSPTSGAAAACSSTACFSTLAPITPDKVQQARMQPPGTEEKSSNQEENKKRETAVSCTQGDNHGVGLILNDPDSSSVLKYTSENGLNGDIDPTQTPQPKPQKRRKHRPKVVVEGKPKRTPRKAASAQKTDTPKEKPTGKRKYVRKKGIKSKPEEQSNGVNEVSASNGDHAKPCRRALNFNLGNQEIESHEKTETENKIEEACIYGDQPCSLNFDAPQNTSKALTSSVQHEQRIGEQQIETHYVPPRPIQPSTPSATCKNNTLNAIARNLKAPNAILYQNSDPNVYNQNTINQGITDEQNERRGSKRDYQQYDSELSRPQNIALVRSSFLCPEMSRTVQPNILCTSLEIGSEAHKKMRSENMPCGTITSTPSCVTPIKDFSGLQAYASHVDERFSNTNLYSKMSSKQAGDGTYGILNNWHTDPLAYLLRQRVSGKLHIVDNEKQCNPMAEIVAEHMPKQDSLNNQYASLSHFESLQGQGTRLPPPTTSLNTPREVGRESSNQIAHTKKRLPRKSKKARSDLQASIKARGELHDGFKHSVSIDILTIRLERIVISDNGEVPNEQTALVPYKGDGTMIPFEGYDLTKRRKPRPKVDLDPETSKLWDLLMGKEGSEGTQTMDRDKEKWWDGEREVFRGRADSFIARMHLVQGDRRFSRWKGSVVDSVIGVFLTQNVTDHLSSSAFMSLAARFPPKPSSMKGKHCQDGLTAWVEEPEFQVIDPDGTITYHHTILKQSGCNQSTLTASEEFEHATENVTAGKVCLAEEQTKRIEEEVISSQNSSDSFTLQAHEEVRSSAGSNSEAEDQISEHSLMNFNSHQIFQHMELTAPFQKFQPHKTGVPLFETVSPPLGCQQSENSVYNTQNVTAAKSNSAFDCEIQSNIQSVQNLETASSNFWLTMKPFLGLEETVFDCLRKEAVTLHSSAISTEKTDDSRRVGHMEGKISSSTAQNTAAPVKGGSINKSEHQVNLQQDSHSGCTNQPTSHEETYNVIEPESTITAHSYPGDTSAKRQSELQIDAPSKQSIVDDMSTVNARKRKIADNKIAFDWDSLRKQAQSNSERKERSKDAMDSIDYEALRHAEVKEISDAIKERGMNNMLAERIKDFLNRIVREHGSVDLEWLRDVPPDKVKEYLLSIRGLGLKSVECVRLLTLHNLAFPVDTNVGRIAVRLGWVPLQPLPESLQLHLLEMYPVLETIQKYLWPRLCKLDQKTLYELHYQMITFGKVFCTKSKPNCNACPMRAECRHFASAFASARLALPGPEEKSMVSSSVPVSANGNPAAAFKPMPLLPESSGGTKSNVDSIAAVEKGSMPAFLDWPMPQLPHITTLNREAAGASTSNCEPIIEEPATPEPLQEVSASDIEDAYYDDPDYIPTIELNMKEFTTNLQAVLQEQNMGMQEGDLSRALVSLNPSAASIPTKLKNISHLRTEHQVYELPDSHPLIKKMDRREPDDPSPYLLAIWTPGETASSIQLPDTKCNSQASGRLCEENTCYSCSCARETNSQIVRGTLLIPCRTATRGSFPLNGTYFQVNEVFADHASSLNPIDVPREMIWYLPRRTVYFGTSVSTIFKGLSTEQIQHCFWRGFVCVRGFDQTTRAPRPLMARLHFPASRMAKNKNETQKDVSGAKRNTK
ncbi:unnamed protein product [Cuscuta epithymum]|uniref:HhH-GPD domain-containing protein n=1 Tax=Cuscuta epithymum TaxID=186058 RepID=A0AAV0EFT7_9ASTE|nr:unnamed protein product [Cuscuta epithymum]